MEASFKALLGRGLAPPGSEANVLADLNDALAVLTTHGIDETDWLLRAGRV